MTNMTTGKSLDLTNMRFSKLLVIGNRVAKRYKGRTAISWYCKCDCGQKKYVRASNLRSGHTKSCGCSRRLESGLAAKRDVFREYKQNAKRRGYLFNLSFDNFIKLISKPCGYCGSIDTKIRKVSSDSGSFVYNGIDRKNNSIGYIIGNCISCCKFCNRAKDVDSEAIFLNKVRKVALYRGLLA